MKSSVLDRDLADLVLNKSERLRILLREPTCPKRLGAHLQGPNHITTFVIRSASQFFFFYQQGF